MRQGVKAFDHSNPGDQLAWLVLRVVAELSPCTETSLIACVSGSDDSNSVNGHASHTRETIGHALLKLKELAFIQLTGKHIVIADRGRLFLDELSGIVLPRGDEHSATASEPPSEPIEQIERALGTALLQITEALNAPNEFEAGRETGKHPKPEAKKPEGPWTRSVALLTALVPTSLTKLAVRCKQFCLNRLAAARTLTRQDFPMYRGPAANATRQACKRSVVVVVELWTILLTQTLARVKAVRRARLAEACAIDLSQLLIIGGAFLVVCGALLIARGIILHPSGRGENSRGSPITWSFDRSDLPIEERSIFATRKVGGDVLIEGFSISGENTSNQTLTAVQGAIKPDASNVELELSVSRTGNPKNQADAPDIPPGGNFTLKFMFRPDAPGRQTGIPAEVFLSKYGGAIFRFSYVMSAVQTTDIEYLSPLRLKAQLAESGARSERH
jgi:hypothetical protein